MKKIVIALCALISFSLVIFAFTGEEQEVEIKNETLSKSFLEKHIPIIDIRTSREWRETGVVKGSYRITFYNDDRSFNEDEFLQKLKVVVRKGDTFAILCRSGNRSNKVTRFLKSHGFPNVINLAGGIKMAKTNGIELTYN